MNIFVKKSFLFIDIYIIYTGSWKRYIFNCAKFSSGIRTGASVIYCKVEESDLI